MKRIIALAAFVLLVAAAAHGASSITYSGPLAADPQIRETLAPCPTGFCVEQYCVVPIEGGHWILLTQPLVDRCAGHYKGEWLKVTGGQLVPTIDLEGHAVQALWGVKAFYLSPRP